ncbi:hypothetical protein ACFORG_11190 [Lutimaribacter marinistellae]|uniref:Aminoglycoside phosphotransferase domain-containing protein n=1 Tax=Lutimaribacter marinistellae TaxID=1820329 RepID=A0ABV7THE5_9RHOB
MAKETVSDRKTRIIAAAEAHFGATVDHVSAPGGEGRSSFRLHFHDRDVIATLRPNFRRTHLEAYVLEKLSAECDDVPEPLGVAGDILFQSDVGSRRLNEEIVAHGGAGRMHLAAEAVSAIFRIHSAARQTELNKVMPHLGANPDWVLNLVASVSVLEPFGGPIPARFDRNAAAEALRVPCRQFVKWDCRSGNAALGRDGTLRWFDFEYSGLRHGAEDFAWLIGDESWPIAPEDMVDIMIDSFDSGCGYDIADYLDYLALYTTFHAVQRLKLIEREARRRGWLTRERVRKYDDAGVHPEFAAQICRVGRYFSAQSRLTAPLTRGFDRAMTAFLEIMREDDARESA